MSRREFVGACAGCMACATAWPVLAAAADSAPAAVPAQPAEPAFRPRVHVFYLFPDATKPNWPNIDYDFDAHIRQVEAKLRARCPDVEFVSTNISVADNPKVPEMLKAESEASFDGYLIYLAGMLGGQAPDQIIASGKPTIIADHLYAGTGRFLTSYARAKRAGLKVIPVTSSRFDDLVQAVNALACLARMKHSKILVVGKEPDPKIEAELGTKVQNLTFEELTASYEAADKSRAKSLARKWIMGARRVEEPSREEITKSACMYLGMLSLLDQHKADAITVHCLHGFYGGKLTAYPCLGFMQLDNDGKVGACEADQNSTLTKLLMTKLTGRPGFISDPVIDTSRNQIIYVHCVASTRTHGPDGRNNPYVIRSHSEDHKGASVQSLMPLGEMTTTVEIHASKKKVLFHQARTVANIDEDMACRTKLAAEVKGDIRKLLTYWDEWGWHRVTFYGDHKQQLYNIGGLLGFEVIEEA